MYVNRRWRAVEYNRFITLPVNEVWNVGNRIKETIFSVIRNVNSRVLSEFEGNDVDCLCCTPSLPQPTQQASPISIENTSQMVQRDRKRAIYLLRFPSSVRLCLLCTLTNRAKQNLARFLTEEHRETKFQMMT